MIYLDNAATTFPKAPGVPEEVNRYLTTYGVSSGRSSYPATVEVSKKIFGCRQNIAELLNIDDSSRVVFSLNATMAINTALKGLLKKGSRVITSELEHNAVSRPLNYLKDTLDIDLITLKSDKDGVIIKEDLEKKLSEYSGKIDLVIINHASNVFGTLQNLKELGALCSAHGVTFMVDAAQTAGEVELNVKEMSIDILAASGHKGLLGPAGSGFLYVRPGIEFPPLIHGGTGSNSEESRQPDLWPDKMESGTLNVPSLIGLEKSTEFILNQSIKKIAAKKTELTSYLIQSLGNIPGVILYGPGADKKRTAPVSFNIKGKKPSQIAAVLNEKEICVRTGLHCAPMAHKFFGTWPEGTVRVSVGYFNTTADIDALIQELDNL